MSSSVEARQGKSCQGFVQTLRNDESPETSLASARICWMVWPRVISVTKQRRTW